MSSARGMNPAGHRLPLVLAAMVGLLMGLALSPSFAHAFPQGPWQLPAVNLSAPDRDAYVPQIAIAPDGSATVVWEAYDGLDYVIQASTRPPGGPFGAPVNLSTPGQDADDSRIATAPDGTATAVWSRSNGANAIIQASTRPPGGSFGAPVNLSAAGQNAVNAKIAVAPDGTATVVWQRESGLNLVVQAATRPPGGSFGAPVTISALAPNASHPQIAVASDGAATVVWERYDGANYVVQAVLRPSGGASRPSRERLGFRAECPRSTSRSQP